MLLSREAAGGHLYGDNRYGEFVEKMEPTDVGRIRIVGSLIKNWEAAWLPIVAGILWKRERDWQFPPALSVPTSYEVGASLGINQLYQGCSFPFVVAER